jgi:hypothetical protein
VRSFIVYIPCIIALSYSNQPEEAYWVAWGGSWFVLAVTFLGIAQNRPKDIGFFEQFFRPYLYMQLMFAVSNCLSSVFYFLHLKGFMFFDRIDNDITETAAFSIANAQFYCLLAHAAYAQGVVLNISKYDKQKIDFVAKVDSSLLTKISIASLLLVVIIGIIGLGSAIGHVLSFMGIMAATLSLVFAITTKKNILLSSILFLAIFMYAMASGMKENIIIVLILLIINLFPKYKVQTIIFALVISNIVIYIPAYVSNVRIIVWYGRGTAADAFEKTYEDAISTDIDVKELARKTQWDFLTFRFSEISMLEQYINYVPSQRNFYGTEILIDGFKGFIPPIIRPDGKSVDKTAMERVYAAGALDRFVGEAGTSAKPSLVADNYLMGGAFTIVIMSFIYGWLATFFSLLCEKKFGGYTIGTIIIYNAAFGVLTKGTCTENMFVSIYYGVIFLIALVVFSKYSNFLGRDY